MKTAPKLCIVIPCYNESAVLPLTAPLFREEIALLARAGRVAPDSFILFANDGSSDETWRVICDLHRQDPAFRGVSLSRNRGHQNALLCGLMEAKDQADVVISADCDGQDDIHAMDQMLAAYEEGNEIVYACRNSRAMDTPFKRLTAEFFYRPVKGMGGEIVFNHADYRLASARALSALGDFREVNLFLRGLFPMLGFRSTRVYYARTERVAGESHYPFLKMLGFAIDGITSLSVRPIRLITILGVVALIASFLAAVGMAVLFLMSRAVSGWAILAVCVGFLGGVQLVSLGVVGEYVGKIYLESKHRPRYIVADRT